MAGLQYYFFPTDFLYPQAPSSATDGAPKAILPVQALKVDGGVDDSVKPTAVDGGRSSSSSPASLVLSQSAIKKELHRGKPIVADPRKSDA